VTEPQEKLAYRPALFGQVTAHYSDSRAGVDEWKRISILAPLSGEALLDPWEGSSTLSWHLDTLLLEPSQGFSFEDLPAPAQNIKSHDKWKKMLATHVYQDCPLVLWKSKSPVLTSQPGETEDQFQARIRQLLREERDLAVEKVRTKYESKIARLRERIHTAQTRVAKEESEYKQHQFQTAISFGSTLMGALFGRKLGTQTNIGKAATAMRGIGRAADQKGDIAIAEEKVEVLQKDLLEMEADLEKELAEIRFKFDGSPLEYDTKEVRPRKSDLTLDFYALVWAPWAASAGGGARPIY
jgi:hypothetical protein